MTIDTGFRPPLTQTIPTNTCPAWCRSHDTTAYWPEAVRHEQVVARIVLPPRPGVDTRSRAVEFVIGIEQVDVIDEDGVSIGTPSIWCTSAAQLDLLPHEAAAIARGMATAAALASGQVGPVRGAVA
jgi:hypothetical protein